MSSRLLERNKGGFENEEEGESVLSPLPFIVDPQNPGWKPPKGINNPYKYGNLVNRLHEQNGLSIFYHSIGYMRFASFFSKKYGYERLVRAAYLAASKARHPFSSRFIEQFLDQVPSNEIINIQLF